MATTDIACQPAWLDADVQLMGASSAVGAGRCGGEIRPLRKTRKPSSRYLE
ncbi:MAG: hypothetical protein ACYTF5_04250 [Planctomycetota bacterium]